jgi:uncharacterized membrane protein YcaP (DUF421 family)
VAQLSLVEFLLVIALGSAVGDALFYPEVPLLHALLVVTLVIGINRGLDALIVRSERVMRLVDGVPVQIVANGRLLHDGLHRRHMGRGEIAAALRAAGVRNLGEVEAAYLESSGKISIFRRAEPQPGLALVPPREIAPQPRLEAAAGGALACCCGCGTVLPAAGVVPDGRCPHCGARDWVAPSGGRGECG